MVFDMMDSERRDFPEMPEAESRAWSSFYHSGSVEDYIRYTSFGTGGDSGAHTAGAQNADQNTGVNY